MKFELAVTLILVSCVLLQQYVTACDFNRVPNPKLQEEVSDLHSKISDAMEYGMNKHKIAQHVHRSMVFRNCIDGAECGPMDRALISTEIKLLTSKLQEELEQHVRDTTNLFQILIETISGQPMVSILGISAAKLTEAYEALQLAQTQDSESMNQDSLKSLEQNLTDYTGILLDIAHYIKRINDANLLQDRLNAWLAFDDLLKTKAAPETWEHELMFELISKHEQGAKALLTINQTKYSQLEKESEGHGDQFLLNDLAAQLTQRLTECAPQVTIDTVSQHHNVQDNTMDSKEDDSKVRERPSVSRMVAIGLMSIALFLLIAALMMELIRSYHLRQVNHTAQDITMFLMKESPL